MEFLNFDDTDDSTAKCSSVDTFETFSLPSPIQPSTPPMFENNNGYFWYEDDVSKPPKEDMTQEPPAVQATAAFQTATAVPAIPHFSTMPMDFATPMEYTTTPCDCTPEQQQQQQPQPCDSCMPVQQASPVSFEMMTALFSEISGLRNEVSKMRNIYTCCTNARLHAANHCEDCPNAKLNNNHNNGMPSNHPTTTAVPVFPTAWPSAPAQPQGDDVDKAQTQVYQPFYQPAYQPAYAAMEPQESCKSVSNNQPMAQPLMPMQPPQPGILAGANTNLPTYAPSLAMDNMSYATAFALDTSTTMLPLRDTSLVVTNDEDNLDLDDDQDEDDTSNAIGTEDWGRVSTEQQVDAIVAVRCAALPRDKRDMVKREMISAMGERRGVYLAPEEAWEMFKHDTAFSGKRARVKVWRLAGVICKTKLARETRQRFEEATC